MADTGIKQYRIPASELPAISSEYQGYDLRYRVISEDKNRISHWSPIQLVKPEYSFVLGNISFNKAGSIASIVWDSVEITKITNGKTYSIGKNHEYDIWIRWDRGSANGDWLYKGRVDSTSLSIPIPTLWTINGVTQGSNPNRMSVEIYLKGEPAQREDGPVGTPFLKVYLLTNQTV